MDNMDFNQNEKEPEKKKEKPYSDDTLKFLLGMFIGALIMFVLCLFIVVIPARKQRMEALEKEKEEVSVKPVAEGDDSALINTETIQKIDKLKQILDTYYYEDVSVDTIRDSIFRAVIASTKDRYSTYYSAEDLTYENGEWEGKFYGIGATLTIDPETNYTLIDAVTPGSPAEKAGIKAGDYIVEVDGVDVGGWSLTEVVKVVRGEEGTDVNLLVSREGVGLEFTITRGEITIDDVKYEKKEDDIGYIQISNFSDIAVEEFEDAINQAKADGVRGVIVDVRGNPGGGLDIAAGICNLFMPQGLIVYTEDKNGQRDEYYSDGKNRWNIPMVVLADVASASASEIFVAAVKDYGVATVVGTTTYGKGVYQVVVSMNDGTAAKVTAGKFYSPKGTCFHEVGVEPDIEVPFDGEAYRKDGTDNQLEKAIEVLKEKMDR